MALHLQDSTVATSRNVSLKDVALFQDLFETELNFLLDRAVPLHYAPGQSIFVEGDPCEGLYVIESGQVKISGFRPTAANRFSLSRVPATP
jgi:hypothetical protein